MKKTYAFLMSAIALLFIGCSAEPVEVTIRADMVAFATGAGIVITAEQETINEDGSITYVITSSNHSKLLDDVSANIDALIAGIIAVGSSDEIFEEIEFSDDYTVLTVKMHDTEVNQFSVIAMYPAMLTALMYQQFNNVEDASINMILIDAGTDEVVDERIFP